MRKNIVSIFLVMVLFSLGFFEIASAQTASLSVFPAHIRQGDPFMVVVDGTEISAIQKLTFAGKKLGVFLYQGKPSALIGIDLNKKPGTYELIAEISNGREIQEIQKIKKNIEIEKRDKALTPLGIPEKIGGNTKASQDKLVATLNADNKVLANIRTNAKSLWTKPFIPPLPQMVVTAPYGNSRKTGEYSIPHKGADYRAKDGTEIMALNRGVVRIAQTFRNHGKTIVIDHGQGLMSFYLHLSTNLHLIP